MNDSEFDRTTDIAMLAAVLGGVIGVILGIAICALAIFAS